MNVAILTAVTDHYDTLREIVPQTVEHEAICVTDDPDLRSDTWNVVYEDRGDVHPNRAAKHPKCCPWRYTDADLTIWIDASFEIVSPQFVYAMSIYDHAQFRHPWRDCAYDEARVSLEMAKYANEPLVGQMADMRERGHPNGWGLWASGLIVRRRSDVQEKFGQAWLDDIYRWSFQDQVSQPPVLREHGLRPDVIPGFYHEGQNPWLVWKGSGRH